MQGRHSYDVAIVGAGPAGLSAARTAARLGFKTLVLERLASPGELAHPCSALIAPLPRQATGRQGSDVYFRKVDLAIPAALIVGYPRQQRWLSPSGFAFDAALSGRKDYPVAAIDKRGLLRMLAEQASLAGAELRYGTEVTGLVLGRERVEGVRVGQGEIRAQMVLSAEGITRELCSSILPFEHVTGPDRYGLIISQDLAAPAVGPAQVGQVVTLGRRYTSARNSFGMLVAPAPGRLSVYFCLFADGPRHFTERSARFYLQEYMCEDPRVRDLCAGAQMLSQSISHTLAGSAPERVTAAGFMGLGDAVTPAGYLGILPAIYLGRQAALVAVEAIDSGDTSAARLGLYEQTFRRRILPELKAEYRIQAGLANMADEDLDSFCQTLTTHRSFLPFSAHARAIEWETVGSSRAHELSAMPTALLTPAGAGAMSSVAVVA